MKITFRLGALATVAMLVVTACSSTGTGTQAPASAAGSPTAAASATPEPYPTAPVKITMWTKEGEADGALQFAKKLAADYTALHSNVTITIVNKDVEKLRQDFLTFSLAGTQPDLLWTVSDHIGPFTSADTIMPLDGMFDPATYVKSALEAVQAGGKTWGIPISYGNQLMLYWNKTVAGETAPADTDALVAAAKTYTDAAAGKYGLVFNQTESFWLMPFLYGEGGSVFASDGKTPTLNTPQMIAALKLLSDWKYTDKIMPKEADYNGAEGLFKSGKAPFIINGDWALGTYSKLFGGKVGVGPIPKIVGADYPKPLVAGAYFMVAKPVADQADKLAVIKDFLKWSTNKANEVAMVTAIKRLPGNAEAIVDPIVTNDPLLKGAAEAAKLGVGTPTQLEMRCVFDVTKAGVRDVLGKQADPTATAAKMQKDVDAAVAPGGACGPA